MINTATRSCRSTTFKHIILHRYNQFRTVSNFCQRVDTNKPCSGIGRSVAEFTESPHKHLHIGKIQSVQIWEFLSILRSRFHQRRYFFFQLRVDPLSSLIQDQINKTINEVFLIIFCVLLSAQMLTPSKL